MRQLSVLACVAWSALWALGAGCDASADGTAPVAAAEPLPDLEPDLLPALAPHRLTPVPRERDPLAAHRPAEVDCPPATWGPEGGGFEVQTGACNYAAFDQPLLVALEAGDALAVTLWYDRLDVLEPAVAHVAVWVGDAVLWEAEVPMPASSAAFDVVVPVEATPPADARLGLHLHNHGFNSWRFVAVDILPGGWTAHEAEVSR